MGSNSVAADSAVTLRAIDRDNLRAILVRQVPRATEVVVSVQPGEGNAAPFYSQLGFNDTGEIHDGEHVYKLALI